MEKIVKKITLLIVLNFVSNISLGQLNFLRTFETYCDTTKIYQYYTHGEPYRLKVFALDGDDGINRIKLYSEMEDTFKYYFNGELKKTRKVDSRAKLNNRGVPSFKVEQYLYHYPEGEDSVLFRLETESHGCLESWIKPEFREVYISEGPDESFTWNIEHVDAHLTAGYFFQVSSYPKKNEEEDSDDNDAGE